MAIVAVVPGALGKALGRLARELEPDAAGALPPHLSLVGEFAARPSFLPLEQHCWHAGHETAPFTIELGAPAVDEDGAVAYLPVAAGGEDLARLHERLLTGRYAPRVAAAPYTPRCVVGPLGAHDPTALDELAHQTEGKRAFLLERFSLMARYPDGSWYERDFYTLDRAATTA